jgi:hypothetical protein
MLSRRPLCQPCHHSYRKIHRRAAAQPQPQQTGLGKPRARDVEAPLRVFTEGSRGWNTKTHQIFVGCYRARRQQRRQQPQSAGCHEIGADLPDFIGSTQSTPWPTLRGPSPHSDDTQHYRWSHTHQARAPHFLQGGMEAGQAKRPPPSLNHHLGRQVSRAAGQHQPPRLRQ